MRTIALILSILCGAAGCAAKPKTQPVSGPTPEQTRQILNHMNLAEPFTGNPMRGVVSLQAVCESGGDEQFVRQSLDILADQPVENIGYFSWGACQLSLVRGQELLDVAAPAMESEDRKVALAAVLVLDGAFAADGIISAQDIYGYFSQHTSGTDHFIMFAMLNRPSDTLLALAGSLGTGDMFRELERADHVVMNALWEHDHPFGPPDDQSSALRQLDRLQRYREWWVRFYAAAMASRLSAWRPVVEGLKTDPDLRVRALAQWTADENERALYSRLGIEFPKPTSKPAPQFPEIHKSSRANPKIPPKNRAQ